MQIYAVNPLKLNSKIQNINNNQPYHIAGVALREEDKPQSIDAMAPHSYQDYNINLSFSGRKPEDFYAQDFIQRDMPATMSDYIQQNPEVVRSHGIREAVPPAQVMAESFYKLRHCSNVADVKKYFPNEPLFEGLQEPNYKAKSGIFSKIGVVRELLAESGVPKGQRTLFKNGLDNPVIYVLRKKYIECKTDEEIQKDIAKDINPHFEMAIKEDGVYLPYSSMHNLGVKNPKLPFWNSLINTREDYAHAYRDRIQVEGGKFVDADEAQRRYGVSAKKQEVYDPSKNRYKPASRITESIGETITNSNVLNIDEISKNIKRGRLTKNTAELSFTQQYWSEIMSVASEKVHLSEELLKFNERIERLGAKTSVRVVDTRVLSDFINGKSTQNLTKSQSSALEYSMKAFWDVNPDLKGHFSTAISDTIKEFAQAYGENGNNEEFRIMCEYAHTIKPNRENLRLKHLALQKEYESLKNATPMVLHDDFGIFKPKKIEVEKNELLEQEPSFIDIKENGDTYKIFENYVPDKNMQFYEVNIDGQKVYLNHSPKNLLFAAMKEYSPLLPDRLINARIKDIEASVGKDFDRLCLSMSVQYLKDGAPESLLKLTYNNDQINAILDTVVSDEKTLWMNEHVKIAVMDWALKNDLASKNDFKMLEDGHSILRQTIYDRMVDKKMHSSDLARGTNEIERCSLGLAKPLTIKERIDLVEIFMDYLKKLQKQPPLSDNVETVKLCSLFSEAANRNKAGAQTLRDAFRKILCSKSWPTEYDYTGKYILNPNSVMELRNYEIETLLNDLTNLSTNKQLFLELFKKISTLR